MAVMVAIPAIAALYQERALEQMRALRPTPFHPSLSDCADLRRRQGWAEALSPKPRTCLAVDWPGMVWRMEIYKSAESRLCKGLIQSSGIKPLAWGLNWNFTRTDPTGTRRWAGSGAARAVGSEKALNPAVA